MTQTLTSNYLDLFVRGVPLLDVRAPVEFAQGAFPNADNLPLLTDPERHEVGLRYNEEGQPAAIKLGHALVGGKTREERLLGWLRWC